jgi:poly(A) polymerase
MSAEDTLLAGARAVAGRLRQAGHQALFAGGCVRDRLMGRPPKDYDVATSARPDEVERLFPRAIGVGKAFGVIRVRQAGHEYEVATFRQDHAYRDGRRPEAVTFSDAEQDARRRDFTINALFQDPATDDILDYVGGQADLAARVLRCVGEPRERFQEDHLRLLRAIRFSEALGFVLHPDTRQALVACAPLITRVSAERIRDELSRILTESIRPGRAVGALRESGLLRHVLPEVEAMVGQEQPPEFHPEGDVFQHTAIMLDLMTERAPLLAWAVLLHDVGKPLVVTRDGDRLRFNNHDKAGQELAAAILRRLCFSNHDLEAIAHMVGNHMRFKEARKMRPATLRRLVAAPTFRLELELHRLDCLASHGKLENHDFLAAFERSLQSEAALPKPWVSGRDLMDLGLREGQAIGRWKAWAHEAQLNGEFADRDALLAAVKARLAAGAEPTAGE